MTLKELLGVGCLMVAGTWLVWAAVIFAIFYSLYKLMQWAGVW
jgi:hypothetical protein